jgi:hypothetical protein
LLYLFLGLCVREFHDDLGRLNSIPMMRMNHEASSCATAHSHSRHGMSGCLGQCHRTFIRLPTATGERSK